MPAPGPQLVFDRLVVGAGNRLAAAAARQAAEAPGRSYNPLVVSGPSGVGKSHLLRAIGHLAVAVEPEIRVCFETVESLVDRVSAGIAEGTLDDLRGSMGRVELLLLDDLQEIAGKQRTQEELLGFCEDLLLRGAQVVVASRRPLQEIEELDPDLAERLAGGLAVEVAPPDEEMRHAVLGRSLAERGASLAPEVVEALAHQPIDSIGELLDALGRVLEVAEAERRAIRADELPALLGIEPAPQEEDEFGAFLAQVSTAVAAVVETAPWRRRIAGAILRWEGEGVRTRRLEAALDADSAPDVEALLGDFAADVRRLREIAHALPAPPPDALLLLDPDRLAEAEALLAATERPVQAPHAPAPDETEEIPSLDAWFFDREKLAWEWLALDDRLLEEQR
ncbi:MAG TPA: DnaA/Hda family protein [Longimicrobiaceae bacterium]|nr:DnaA/Hda family protein [Longimicrobiaceae bacterium]